MEEDNSTGRKKSAFYFIVLMGIVSLFGDITYEGARSITGPFFATLGASAAAIGFISGLGEFIGYALRLLSGYVSDKSEQYWLLTFIGYALILSIPLLAFAGHWQTAALLIILERLGKAVRSPARDAILSHATKQLGRGIGFGIHEFLDQTGAVIGPLTFTAVFLQKGNYRDGFALMAVPAVFTIVILFIAMRKYPSSAAFEPSAGIPAANRKMEFSSVYWVYLLFVFFSVAGFAGFPLISYHLKVRAVITDAQIPLLYAIAMGVDGLTALAIGKLYDKIGMRSLLMIPVFTLLLPLFAFSSHFLLAVTAAVLWGIIMGTHETTMRAAIADLTPGNRRGMAYGIFNTAYGAAFLIGSTAMGILYQHSIQQLILFVIIIELIAIPASCILTAKAAHSRPA